VLRHLPLVRVVVFILFAFALTGCRSAQLGHDQSDMRETLLRLYQSQILDNLVRTKLNYPIVQVDYSNLTGTVEQVAAAGVGGSARKEKSLFDDVKSLLLSWSVTATETANLTMTGQPVITTDVVYQAYIDALQKDPDLVKPLADKEKLAPGSYHVRHEFRGRTWYVPADKAPAFFKLYLATTVQRETKVPVTLTTTGTITGTVGIRALSGTESLLEVRLKEPIRGDSGQAIITLNGIEHRFGYQRPQGVDPGEATDRILLKNDQTAGPKMAADALAKDIAGKQVRLTNDTFVPAGPGLVVLDRDPLESIRSQLELQRLQRRR